MSGSVRVREGMRSGGGPEALVVGGGSNNRKKEEKVESSRVAVANWSLAKLVVESVCLLVYPEKSAPNGHGGCGLACCDHCPFGEGCV